ncbi:uncharacterized protein LY79DRAFT_546070 [Colletotrichum navitas]|uniref:Uncharacterized protein n=1 Tax=Colletotrichum navitas TaxID=681940 RepID=A0AAD8Q4M6_9PEZI|nr:uncharacterized protein LY79DRAFT_546070 [Colletotrichum navitas]KAK1595792.1 hypothetical protein LY79DRAFT_546070 [Colletotrichum navitas]
MLWRYFRWTSSGVTTAMGCFFSRICAGFLQMATPTFSGAAPPHISLAGMALLPNELPAMGRHLFLPPEWLPLTATWGGKRGKKNTTHLSTNNSDRGIGTALPLWPLSLPRSFSRVVLLVSS